MIKIEILNYYNDLNACNDKTEYNRISQIIKHLQKLLQLTKWKAH